MATLSVLSYGSLPQALTMKNGSSSSSNTPTVGDNASNNVGVHKSSSSSSSNLSKTFSRITMQNVLSESNGNARNISNNVNTIVRKIKDFGMFGSVNNAAGSASLSVGTARKRLQSECKTKAGNKHTPTATKTPKLGKDAKDTPKTAKKTLELENKLKLSTNNASTLGTAAKKPGGTPGRKGLPLPQAVARRNARERNRVKQVNNGFAALRERIPEEVAEAFESQGAGRGNAVKKLSKVETLRMAVEYIRSLERLLGFDFPIGSDRGLSLNSAQDSSSENSFTLVKDEFDALSPALDEHFDDSLSNYDMDEYLNSSHAQYDTISESPSMAQYQMDLLPNITTLNGLQYIRIPGTNTYQLLTPDIFVGNSNSPPNSSIDEEPYGQTLIDTNCLSPTTSTSTAADLHASPPSITTNATATAANAPANTLHPNAATSMQATAAGVNVATSGECVNVAAVSTLSRSPVPQSTSPTASTALHHQRQQQQQQQPAVLLSPADNELLLQTCASERSSDERQFVLPTTPRQQQQHQQMLQPHAIKQECGDTTDFVSATNSSTGTLLFRAQTPTTQEQAHYQLQQQEQLLLGHASLSISPPLERCGGMPPMVPTSASTPTLPAFYDAEHSASFYEGVVTFKKELNGLLETSAAANAAAVSLSDENMIEVIDWWEAHTPQSDGGAAML